VEVRMQLDVVKVGVKPSSSPLDVFVAVSNTQWLRVAIGDWS